MALDLVSKLPTDLEVLERIYADYSLAFRAVDREQPSRGTKILVPIDIHRLAARLKTDPEELFGRLYYHLDRKYRYQQENGSFVHLFAFTAGTDRHCINFPYLSAILAEYRAENRRNSWALGVAVGSLWISLAALGAQILGQ